MRRLTTILIAIFALKVYSQEIGIVMGSDTLVTSYQAYNKSKSAVMTSAGNVSVSKIDHIIISDEINELVINKFDELGLTYSDANGKISGVSTLVKKKTGPYGNFALIDGKIYYQNVFDMPGKSADDIEDILLIRFKSLSFDETNYIVDFRKYGGDYMSTSFILSNGQHFFDVNIQIKDGRYRVVTSNHRYIEQVKSSETIFGLAENDNAFNTLESVTIRNNGELRKNTTAQETFQMFSKSLDDYFGNVESTNEVINASDW